MKFCSGCSQMLEDDCFHRRKYPSGRWGLQTQCKACHRRRAGSVERVPWIERFWRQVDKSGDCWLWKGPVNGSGYGYCAGPKGGQDRAHRVSFIIANGSIEKDACILHACDVRVCVNPSHLREGTRAENSRDMVSRGRSLKGGRQPNAKLSEDDVQAIIASTRSSREEAALWPVSARTVRKIRQGRAWAHMKAQE